MSQEPCQRRIAVVIPCYKVSRHLAGVLSRIGPEVTAIYCVIDGCPDGSFEIANQAATIDARIRVISLSKNSGVGFAFIAGAKQALSDGAEIIVKLDGDGQMHPEQIPLVVEPLVLDEADFAKGNRFFHLEDLQSMPILRMIGNAGLSFFSKLSTGYWNLFDPTNGFIAIQAELARRVPWDKVHRRFFFESDLLFRLYTLRAIVVDVPMKSHYGSEQSNLSVLKALVQFPYFHLLNFVKRVFYCYFLREFNIASLNLLLSIGLIGFGVCFGTVHWIRGNELNQLASAGTVMFAALPVILGWQALLAFFAFDVGNVPKASSRSRISRT
jgi:dolichol-phosphate mannosyltransferase